jgi:hypothetical protein
MLSLLFAIMQNVCDYFTGFLWCLKGGLPTGSIMDDPF